MLEIIVDTNSIKNIDFSATENVHRPPFRRLKMKENKTAMSTYKMVLIPYENAVIDRKLVKFFVTNSMTIPRTKDIKPSMTPYRSEEHTSELQSRENLVCRLLLEKKKKLNTH